MRNAFHGHDLELMKMVALNHDSGSSASKIMSLNHDFVPRAIYNFHDS